MSLPIIHPNALCESDRIGPGTRIWAFVHILPGAVIGADNNICDSVFIENDVVIGDRVTVKCGVQLWDGLRVEDDVFIGPNATFTNDAFPRSRVRRPVLPPTTLCRGASIGANATVLPGIRVGPGAMVGAGTVITTDVPANAVVAGNPSRIIGYVDAESVPGPVDLPTGAPCTAIRADVHRDVRGRLSHWPLEKAVPFLPRRLYLVDGAPDGWARGGGAYRRSHQLLIATQGALTVAVDDGRMRLAVRLAAPEVGLHVPPNIWTLQYGHTPDASLLVLASELFDPGERVVDYAGFRADM
jgi:UDP-2-acetamido-3-amino-2,3-dideoxy-glucuronate N-acetyltransferase